MGKYLQRTSGRMGEEIRLPQSQESTTPEQDSSPVLTRLKIAMTYMVSKGANLSNGRDLKIRVITKIMNEALEDLRDSDLHPDVMALYIRQLSAITLWIADGTWNTSIPMPEDFEIEQG